MLTPPLLSALIGLAMFGQTPATVGPPNEPPAQAESESQSQTPSRDSATTDRKTPPTPAADTRAAEAPTPPAPPLVSQGAAAVVLGATETSASVRLRLSLEDSPAITKGDFQAGPIVQAANPTLAISPQIDVTVPAEKDADTFLATFSGLLPFGEYSIPVLFRSRQVETVRFVKPGLIVQPRDAPTVAYQKDGYVTLVLENPSQDSLGPVTARLRVEDVDQCQLAADQSRDVSAAHGNPPFESDRSYWPLDLLWWFWSWVPWAIEPVRPPPPPPCLDEATWTPFAVRPSSRVSLRIPLPDAWFEDRISGLTRSALRSGVLTLRYQTPSKDAQSAASATSVSVLEQNVPVNVQFEARTGRLFWTIVRIFALLLAGALVFLALRVSIPNYRRSKVLKDKLNDARLAIANLSYQLDSQLRVLVGVDRLVLDARRHQGWVILPGFDERAKRVEAGLVILSRKLALVEKLDAVSCRRDNLLAAPMAPTRVEAINRNLDAACEALKSDQLSESDWITIEQRLSAADKETRDRTPEETQAFEEALSQRWKVIASHFRRDANTGALLVPAPLQPMAKSFPNASLLPVNGDEDGKTWIATVGLVRADLQLTALELLREAHFLATALDEPKWADATGRLADWLVTPAVPNLTRARALLAQVAEGITEQAVVDALTSGEAYIDLDPQCVSPNQSVRLTVRFREPRLNDTAARAAVECEWYFEPPTRRPKRLSRFGRRNQPAPAHGVAPTAHVERGWRVHRYFEPDVVQQHIHVAFFFRGQPIVVGTPATFSRVVVPEESVHNKREGVEGWRRAGFQTLQVFAALLVPMVTLAITTAGEPNFGRWWDLVGLGFGSEAIRNILTGDQPPSTT